MPPLGHAVDLGGADLAGRVAAGHQDEKVENTYGDHVLKLTIFLHAKTQLSPW